MNQASGNHSRPIHILVVDDDKDIRDLIEQEIEHSGYTCWTADGGLEALDLLETEPVDVGSLDVHTYSRDSGFGGDVRSLFLPRASRRSFEA